MYPPGEGRLSEWAAESTAAFIENTAWRDRGEAQVTRERLTPRGVGRANQKDASELECNSHDSSEPFH